MISKLATIINEGGNNDQVRVCEELIADELEEYVQQKHFFELPTNEILKIVDKSDIENIDLICSIITKMSESKKEESVLLLNVIKANENTLEECIKIVSNFNCSPICRRIGELLKENEALPERDTEQEIAELKKEIEDLKNKTKEKTIYFPPSSGQLDIVKYLYETCHAKVTREIIENAKTEEIKKYLHSKQCLHHSLAN